MSAGDRVLDLRVGEYRKRPALATRMVIRERGPGLTVRLPLATP
jgi:hypothetical protein